MGKTNNYFNTTNEIRYRTLEFKKKKYKVQENFGLAYFVAERADEIEKKAEEEEKKLEEFNLEEEKRLNAYIEEHGTDEGFEPRTYKSRFNEAYESLKMMRRVIIKVVGEDFLEVVEQSLNSKEFVLMFYIVVNMMNGLDEDEAFDQALAQQKKMNII